MGSLCSKSSTHEGGHTILGPGDAGSTSLNRPDPRAAAAEAAERRVKLVRFSQL